MILPVDREEATHRWLVAKEQIAYLTLKLSTIEGICRKVAAGRSQHAFAADLAEEILLAARR